MNGRTARGGGDTRDKLIESRARYQLLFDSMLEGLAYCRMIWDDDGEPVDWIYLDVNPAFSRHTALTDVCGKRVTELIPGIRESNPELFEIYGRVTRSGVREEFETDVDQLGVAFHVSVFRPEPEHFVAVFEDVTVRDRATAEVAAERDRSQSYLDVAGVMLLALAPDATVVMANRQTCEVLGREEPEVVAADWFELAVPEAEQDGQRSLFGRILAGEIERWSEIEQSIITGDGIERLIAWNHTTVVDDSGAVIGTLSSGEDITERKLHEEELSAAFRRLQRSMKGTTALTARIIESRDPYTAGHQEGVAQLAVAFAESLELPAPQIDCIRTAALLHDIGKVGVPAEILAKPRQLVGAEWALVQQHPEIGASALEKAEFEGPVADIVRQHHERVDGSGYPRGLAGDDIMFEARLLAVADVVEAMLGHRPYRPAHSLDETRDELIGGRGRLYDANVVDTCLAVLANPEIVHLVQAKGAHL